MRYYAFNSGISTVKLPGSIEITETQFLQAEEAIENGFIISVTNGFEIKTPPTPLDYIIDGKKHTAIGEIPERGELYIEDEWFFSEGIYIKKDEKYNFIKQKQTILEQLDELDRAISTRTLRQAAYGDKEALARISKVEKNAEQLRLKLKEIDSLINGEENPGILKRIAESLNIRYC